MWNCKSFYEAVCFIQLFEAGVLSVSLKMDKIEYRAVIKFLRPWCNRWAPLLVDKTLMRTTLFCVKWLSFFYCQFIMMPYTVLCFLISNFRHVMNVVFFLLGNSPASELYVSTFRNTVCSIFIGDERTEWILSFGSFPGDWILCVDVSEHSVSSIFIGDKRTECVLSLGDSPAFEFYLSTFRNTPSLFHLLWIWRWKR